MIRNLLLLAGWVVAFGLSINAARADTFTATYRELALSPANYETTWYSGAVTRDGKFVYGLGHSHNSYGDNSLWLYDPATNTHKNLQPSTGNKWLWDKDANNQAIPKSGRWADPTIRALTNRNNHQAFYVAGRDEFWVLAGTTFYQSSPYFGGRFSLTTNRWEYLSPPWAEKTRGDLVDFADGVVANMGGWTAANAVTATCLSADTVVLFGGMSDSTGAVRIIEPNPAGPEPYRMVTSPKPPFHFPVENARHNAACVGDTVYFVEGQRRVPNTKCCTTPDPAQAWKFHVPTRTWTRLPDGPPGGYFAQLTADTTAQALVLYGGSKGNKLWVYDLINNQWHNLTGTIPNLPRADMHTGGFIPGFGHLYKGGERYKDAYGTSEGYGASRKMMVISLTRNSAETVPPVAEAPPAEETPVVEAPPAVEEPPIVESPPPTEVGASVSAVRTELDKAKVAIGAADALLANLQPSGGEEPTATDPPATEPPPTTTPPAEEPPPTPTTPTDSAAAISWTSIPLPGTPKSPQGTMKHQRLAEGPDGRVYLLGGDWGGLDHENTGRQEVYSFDPLSPTGDWRLEAPYCGTVEHPVHWHTDEAGVVWDAKRKVFWKVAGTEYGPDGTDPTQPQYDACLAAGKSVKAKVITFDPVTKLWSVPPHVVQTRFGYAANGVMDPDKDQMVQIIDTAAKHLDLATGQWATYVLPAGPLRFNAITARIGRTLWWVNREEALESYDLDTHKLSGHGQWPFLKKDGWGMAMTFASGDKVLAVWPTAGPAEPRFAALYDPATKAWTKLDQGAGWGNGGVLHSSGKLILMGGGINGPADHNKQVWVGTIQ